MTNPYFINQMSMYFISSMDYAFIKMIIPPEDLNLLNIANNPRIHYIIQSRAYSRRAGLKNVSKEF